MKHSVQRIISYQFLIKRLFIAMPPKQRALEKAAKQEEERDKKAKDAEERMLASEWSVGAKDNSKEKAKEDKEMEKARKAAEKAAILAAEEAENSGVKRVVKTKKKGKVGPLKLLSVILLHFPDSYLCLDRAGRL
jgi:beta-glucosidase-like glycosyl hydrolase